MQKSHQITTRKKEKKPPLRTIKTVIYAITTHSKEQTRQKKSLHILEEKIIFKEKKVLRVEGKKENLRTPISNPQSENGNKHLQPFFYLFIYFRFSCVITIDKKKKLNNNKEKSIQTNS